MQYSHFIDIDNETFSAIKKGLNYDHIKPKETIREGDEIVWNTKIDNQKHQKKTIVIDVKTGKTNGLISGWHYIVHELKEA